jgi:DNA primase
MAHPASRAVPILAVAAALRMEVTGRKARCFNGAAHKSGSDEKPALTFQTDVNRFKCYACGVKGDAIDLVRGVLGVSFGEAVQRLAEMAGGLPAGAVPAVSPVPTSRTPTPRARDVYARLFELSYALAPGSPGGEYLRGRGIGLELAEQHRVTELRSPREVWERLADDFDEDDLWAAGLVSRRGRFLFGGHRLLFFHFAGHWPQYVMARDITGASPCKELSLAGLHSPVPYLTDVLALRPARVLVCEGCVDTLSAAQLGYAAVGVPGVVGFREDWFPLFRGVGRVTVLFDNDAAGRRQGAELRARFRLRGIPADAEFPARGKDLNDLLKLLNKGGEP